MSAVVTTFGTQMQATPVKQASMAEMTARTTASTHTKRQRMVARHRRDRSSAHMLKSSAKKTKRVPKAKSLSKLSY
jgi:hypothetical protein